MKRGIEEQLDLFNKKGDSPLKPETGAEDKKAEPNKPSQRELLSESHGHSKHGSMSDAERKLGWAGRYYGNDPDNPKQ